MTVVAGAAAVPAAPLLLPEASPAQPEHDRRAVAALRERVRAVLAALPAADVTVVIAPGPAGVHERAVASLRPLGIAADDVVLPVDASLVPHTTRLTQYPLALGGALGIEHTVLVRLLADGGGRGPVLPLTVPPGTDGQVLVNVGASLVEALRDAHRSAVVVAAADASAGLDERSPGHRIDGAAAWDRRLVTAVAERDADAVAGLGPAEAGRVAAAGWAPLTTLLGVAAAARLRIVDDDVAYAVVRGVGRVTTRLEPRGGSDVGGSFRRDDTAPLQLPRDPEARR